MNTAVGSPFGEQLRASREACGMSREALAVEVHRSALSIQRWEMGQTLPPRSVRVYLAQLLDDSSLIEVER